MEEGCCKGWGGGGYLAVSRMLGIGWAEEELVSFQFSFDSLTEYRFREKLQRWSDD